MLDNIIKNSMLYDFYGILLPHKQREIFSMYYHDNLSLGEIAEEYGLTRQGIHETIKRGENKLTDFESKLGLIEKYRREEGIVRKLTGEIDCLIREHKGDLSLTEKLVEIKDTMAGLNK